MDALDRINQELTGPGEALSQVKDCCPDTSVIGHLQRKKVRLEADLGRVNAALEALNQNPEVARVFELVARAR
jgi:hypothetical protein